jgi:DNA-binding NtrC family response regulator
VAPPEDQTFTESPAAPVTLARPEPHLVVVLECDRPLSGSSRHSLRGIAEVTLGRGPERTAMRQGERLTLTVPGRWMSAAHARIRRDVATGEGRWVLEDLDSRNGTRVNGQAVVHAALADGDLIEAGHTLIVFRDALHAPPTAALDFDVAGASSLPSQSPHALQAGKFRLTTLLPAVASELETLVRIAPTPLPVLLRGETGTGKEVVAQVVHALSHRRGPFVAVNCGGLPETLVESQLFGHTKGAFSGAVRDAPGFVRAAGGGTLFLDEIGDLAPNSQAALLRVLQEREVVPVGTTLPAPVDFRVISATHQPLEAMVARGTFRADLLARLDGFSFILPPLRERREDIGLFVADLLGAPADAGTPAPPAALKLSPDAGRALLRYEWPLNIRELAHCLARACAVAETDGAIELGHLPPQVREHALAGGVGAAETTAPNDDSRLRAQLEALLTEHQGNVAQVARAVGKARMQVHRWLRRFEIDPGRYRA